MPRCPRTEPPPPMAWPSAPIAVRPRRLSSERRIVSLPSAPAHPEQLPASPREESTGAGAACGRACVSPVVAATRPAVPAHATDGAQPSATNNATIASFFMATLGGLITRISTVTTARNQEHRGQSKIRPVGGGVLTPDAEAKTPPTPTARRVPLSRSASCTRAARDLARPLAQSPPCVPRPCGSRTEMQNNFRLCDGASWRSRKRSASVKIGCGRRTPTRIGRSRRSGGRLKRSLLRGDDFDRQFWVTVDRDERATSDRLAAAAGSSSHEPLSKTWCAYCCSVDNARSHSSFRRPRPR